MYFLTHSAGLDDAALLIFLKCIKQLEEEDEEE